MTSSNVTVPGGTKSLASAVTRLLSGLAILVIAVACQQFRPWDAEYREIDHWTSADRFTFGVDTLDQSGIYDLRLALRTTASTPYPYQRLVVEVRQQWFVPNGKPYIATDTLECDITDTEGRRIAEGGVSLHPYEFAIRRLNLPRGAYATITVRHLMSQYEVQGFSDIGIITTRH